ncbi:MAG: flagellar export chaperone FliS [Candidatus Riflebacteria bacterium]|nr:flagellar export chaperone FliS [Candidatus Riflebacteria bacterium]
MPDALKYIQGSRGAAYKKTQIETASQETLIVMMFDGALKFLGFAETAFEEKNIEKISNNLNRVQAIFSELLASLNKEKGGEIADSLESIYIYFIEQLANANMNKDLEPVLLIKPMIKDMRDAWENAAANCSSSLKTAAPQRLSLAV